MLQGIHKKPDTVLLIKIRVLWVLDRDDRVIVVAILKDRSVFIVTFKQSMLNLLRLIYARDEGNTKSVI